ncbi:MAG: 50S ribosomal protein L17 [Chloroflexi bacterium]|nr:50S ribosomal protein L17 [Chloroflexota bacterium]
MAGSKLGRPTGHQGLLFRNLVTDLLRYEAITTTEAKALAIRGTAEKMITLGKQNTLHARRQAAAAILDANVLARLFSELGPRYAQRSGGYTRLVKLGPRLGDNAPMVRLELLS